ncbi:hypothetical protein ACFSJQ_20595 [Vibrio olivae]
MLRTHEKNNDVGKLNAFGNKLLKKKPFLAYPKAAQELADSVLLLIKQGKFCNEPNPDEAFANKMKAKVNIFLATSMISHGRSIGIAVTIDLIPNMVAAVRKRAVQEQVNKRSKKIRSKNVLIIALVNATIALVKAHLRNN